MYLSRLILNPLNRQVQREIAQPYEMHRTILRAFPDHLDQTDERVLWRVDSHRRTGALHLLVQSQSAPDWTRLEPADRGRPYLAPIDGPNPAVKQVNPSYRSGQVLAFRLLANPTKRLGKAYGKDKGKRVGLYKPEEQLAWLNRKAEAAGFAVLSATPHAPGKLRDSQRNLELLNVRFDGLLQVTEPAQLSEAIAQGIGSGKAFGFGLLSVAPARG